MEMTIKRITAWIAVAALAVSANIAAAQTQSQPGPISRAANTINPLNWQMPQWKMPSLSGILPAKEEKARIVKKKDSLLDEVKQTASSSWRKTKETFNPQKLNPARFFPASARTPASPPENQKPGFFSSLFNPQPREPERSGTVTDFLGQAKPRG